MSKMSSIMSKIEGVDTIGEKEKKKSEIIADRVEQRWAGNGGNGHNGKDMQVIDIKLSCKGPDTKKLIIKLKAPEINKEMLANLPSLVEKFF